MKSQLHIDFARNLLHNLNLKTKNASNLNRFFILALSIAFFLLGTVKVSAQFSINLKTKPKSEAQAFLNWHSEQDLSTQRIQMPGMQHFSELKAIKSLKKAKTKSNNSSISSIYTLEFEGSALQDKIAALLATQQFEWVEANRQVQAHAFLPTLPPNDADISEQWYHEYIQTFAAWDSTRGKSEVVIGVLDTGLDYDHPEFEGQIAINSAEDKNGNGHFEPWPDTIFINGISGDFDGIDQDNNGFIDDVIGYDFTDQPRSPFGGDYLFEDPDPLDDNNHGTLVAGIIAAKADNNFGGAGIAPGCKLKILRAFGANGGGEDDDIARAIVYAADNGIKILNFSFGDIYPSQMMHEAIIYAEGKGVVMIASAGNGTGDNLHYPSNFDEVISVSASAITGSQQEILWPLSSYGTAVSLCAPGSGIYAPMVRDTSSTEPPFDFFSGTSTSAPMVTAAVGLLFAQRGACSPQQIRGILSSSADDIGSPGWDHFTGAGRLNILKALQTVGSSEVQILSPQNDRGSAQNSIPIIVTALDPQFESLHIEYQQGIEGNNNWTTIRSDIQEQIRRDTIAIWNISALSEGDYTLRLRMEKTNGTTAEDRIRFVIDRSVPTIEIRRAVPAWDNYERKMLWVYRASDRSQVTLHYRPFGSTNFVAQVNDRITRHGSFLLGIENLSAGAYEYYLEAENEAGLNSSTSLDTFNFIPEFVPLSGLDTLNYSMPMGHYITGTQDLDGDGLLEVIMSEYNEQLSFGKLKSFEYNATQFTAIDSINIKPVLIPKAIADTDGNGLLELLCSVNDSIYLFEQTASNTFPSSLKYTNFNNDLFAASFADTDNDGVQELLAKDFVDYKVLEGNASIGFNLLTTLADNSPDYAGSVAPKVLVEDFDGDGKNEIIFGDFDGDFLVYEWDGISYRQTWLDTTQLTKSGSYLCSGDFDGDGRKEFFVATHTSLNRNETDFEYEPGYWYLRIFKSNANDQYSLIFEDFLFDIDTDNFNAATAGNIDTDAADELIFSTFPRTYILDFANGNFQMKWFHYGDLCTHHFIADFNGNGVNEIAIGRGDKAIFWEEDFNYSGPQAVTYLNGYVKGPNQNELEWSASPNANEYRIWRGPILGNGNILINLIDSTTALNYTDNSSLISGTPYLYVLESKNTSLNPVYSPFSYAVVLIPHALGRLDSVLATGPRQVKAYFSVPIWAQSEAAQYFSLNDTTICTTVNSSGDRNQSILLSFENELNIGSNNLKIDSLFLDADRAPLDPNFREMTFLYNPENTEKAYFTHWEIVSSSQAKIWFNLPMTDDVLEIARYQALPFGKIVAVDWAENDHSAVLITLEGAALGALGYPVSIILHGGLAQNNAPMMEKSGNVATFSEFKADLSGVYVYPNPYQTHTEFEGIRFANLSKTATIHIYSASGKKVITLEENNGDGGLEWNLIDQWGERIRPGVYLFRVESEGLEAVIGKFDILD